MNDDYETPQWLKRFFEGWDDPCPLSGANLGGEGLLRDWGNPTFANIPYSRENVNRWVDKAILESRRGTKVVLLVRVDPSTRWWLHLVAAGGRFAFFHGRLSFENSDGNKRPANFASALVFL